jgi:hypothetical protein
MVNQRKPTDTLSSPLPKKMLLNSVPPTTCATRVSSSAWVKDYKIEIGEPDQPSPSVFEEVYEASRDHHGQLSITLRNPASRHLEARRSKNVENLLSTRGRGDTAMEATIFDFLQNRLHSGDFLSREVSRSTVTGLVRSSTVELLQSYGLLSNEDTATTERNTASMTNNLLTTTVAVRANQRMVTPPCRVQSEDDKAVVEVMDKDVMEFDILSGRGGKSNHHPGNKRFRQIVAEMKSKYRTTGDKEDKTALSRAIVKYILEMGGRFLKKKTGRHFWTVMTINEARKKTSQALRETKELKWTLEDI